MTVGSPALCRVSIHLDDIGLDVALPAAIPIGLLLPSLYEIAASQGAIHQPWTDEPPRYLSPPGLPALDSSMSLSENGIRDGAVLVLSEHTAPAPQIRAHHDAAELLARTEPGWTVEHSRFAGLLTAIALTAQGTFLAVPGPSAVPRLLLAAAATSMVSVVAMLVTDCGGQTLTVIALVGGFICVTAVPATIFAISLTRTGAGLAVLSIIALSLSARVAVLLSGLGPRPPDLFVGRDSDAEAKVRCARRWLSCLTSAAAVCSAAGVVSAVCGAPSGWTVSGLAAAVSAVLLLRARTVREPVARICLLAAGITSAAALLLAVRQAMPTAPWAICLLALGAAGIAIWLGHRGFREPGELVRRTMASAELLAQAAVIPLAVWVLGLYAGARGLGPW